MMMYRAVMLASAAMALSNFACAVGTADAPATSSDDNAPQLEDIVVTAQRRGERLQDVPIAVTAVTADLASARGIDDTQSLAQAVPGLTFSRNGPSGSLFLRGVGSNAGNINDEPSVAVYVDDVYIATPVANIFALNNIDRVEILKGPQGTLFGRNATGGVIQIVTRDPTQEAHLDSEVGYGNYDTASGSIYATGGIVDNLAADLAVVGSHQGDGWGHDFTNGQDTYRESYISARSKFLYTPMDDFKARLSLDYNDEKLLGLQYRQPEGVVGIDGSHYPGYYNARGNSDAYASVKQGGASLRLDYDLQDIRLVSISAYRKVQGEYALDEDTTPINVVDATLDEQSHNYSQELQMISAERSKIQWLVGAFYYDFYGAFAPGQIAGLAATPFPALNIYNATTTKSGSLYAQATTEIVADTNVTMGYRYTLERQEVNGTIDTVIGSLTGPVHDSQSFNKGTWRFALDHKFATDVLGYVSYNRGIKSGGFNLLSVGTPGFQPEQLDAYEIGVKNELFDRRVQLDLAGFYYKYTNIQEAVAQLGSTYTINAAKARAYGLDATLRVAVARNFDIDFAATYLDSTYRSFPKAQTSPADAGGTPVDADVVGEHTPQAPTFTGNIGGTYTVPTTVGNFELNGSVSHNSGYVFTADNSLREPQYSLVNASFGWKSTDGRYGASLWGKNLNGAEYLQSGTAPAGIGYIVLPAAPRTFGIKVSSHF